MIEFKMDRSAKTNDIALSRFESLTAFTREVERQIDQKDPCDSIHIAFIPPINPNISIPIAFKVVMSHINQMREKQLSILCQVESEDIIDYLVKYMPAELAESTSFTFGKVEVSIRVADIIAVKTDSIVNASNRELKLGGGVSGSIANAANPQAQLILNGMASSQKLEHGDAVLTDSLGVR